MDWLLAAAAASLGVAALAGLWNAYQFRGLSKNLPVKYLSFSLAKPSSPFEWGASQLRVDALEGTRTRRRLALDDRALRRPVPDEKALRRLMLELEKLSLDELPLDDRALRRFEIKAVSRSPSSLRAWMDTLSWRHRRA
ncbi:MAG: hypothetical protein F4Y94_07480 [Chloroflexi bacterium]|nr:hypothetical protein [Chloroflexota bacterium]